VVTDAIVGTDWSTVTTSVAAAVFPYKSVSVGPLNVTVPGLTTIKLLQPLVVQVLLAGVVEVDETVPPIDGIIFNILSFVMLSESEDPVSSELLKSRVMDGVNVVFSIFTLGNAVESAEVTPPRL
jgi:hypothetical protein